jgi:uncharacterized protein (TIGR02147 family)
MPDISSYTDYRRFLGDYYKEAKGKNQRFSYQIFAKRAGFKSKSFICTVVQGKRSLSRACVIALSQAMKLNKTETDYFENLVGFNQAFTLQERNHYFEKLSSIKTTGKNPWKPQLLRNDQYEFYSRPQHAVIRALIDQRPFKGDYAWLAKSVRPRITVREARISVELLARLGFIKKRKDGVWEVIDKVMVTSPEVTSLAIQNFHRQTGELALQALSDLPKDKRNITSVTLGISPQTYKVVCDEIQAFRERLACIA